jgi:hypothetical protein
MSRIGQECASCVKAAEAVFKQMTGMEEGSQVVERLGSGQVFFFFFLLSNHKFSSNHDFRIYAARNVRATGNDKSESGFIGAAVIGRFLLVVVVW